MKLIKKLIVALRFAQIKALLIITLLTQINIQEMFVWRFKNVELNLNNMNAKKNNH